MSQIPSLNYVVLDQPFGSQKLTELHWQVYDAISRDQFSSFLENYDRREGRLFKVLSELEGMNLIKDQEKRVSYKAWKAEQKPPTEKSSSGAADTFKASVSKPLTPKPLTDFVEEKVAEPKKVVKVPVPLSEVALTPDYSAEAAQPSLDAAAPVKIETDTLAENSSQAETIDVKEVRKKQKSDLVCVTF